MSKNQAVKVAIRIRPLNKREINLNSPVCVDSEENVLIIKKDKDAKQFIFDYVFGIDSRQESIYESCAYSLVESGLQGYNGTVFAYGQTGAGKTFTMVGDYKDPQIKGIIPRTFQHVISAIQTSEQKQYVIRASFIEIYNQDIMDLLEDKKKMDTKRELKESPQKGVFIKDLKMVPVKSVEELFHVLDFGNVNRTVHSTAMNATSSRSHALFTIHVQSLEGKQKVKGSKINLVDLAGSQRQSKTEATGDRLKEGAKINLSLTALGNVINSLVDGKKGGHIPYRDSKLTRLLQDSLGGNTKTLMIASASPAADNYDETVSTLRYAARARNIKNKPKINQDPKDAMIREYLEQIQKLKRQLGGGGGQILYVSQDHTQIIKEAQEKVEERQKQLSQKQQEIYKMREKLKEMEQLVLKKEEVSPQVAKTRKLKNKKIQKQKQLRQRRVQQLEKQQQKLVGDQEDEPKGDSMKDKFDYWKDIAKKLKKKLKSVITDKQDLQKQFETERQDLNKTIRDLEGDLSFYKQLSEKFINVQEIATLKLNSTYNEQKREYSLPSFLMHEQSVTLPKTLKKNEIDDLWKEKRKHIKMQLVDNTQMPSISPVKKTSGKSSNHLDNVSSPIMQDRKLFKLPDYTNPKYQQKQIDVNRADHIFRRTNFKINNDKSRGSSRNNSRSNSNKKLQPLSIKKKQEYQRPTSRSRGKQKLQPIKR